MDSLKFAKVAVDGATFGMDKLYDYRVPPKIADSADVGCRVIVPFGRSSGKRQGIIMEVSDSSDVAKIKPLTALLDASPILSDAQLGLVRYLKETTFCTFFDAVRAILPAGLNYRLYDAYSVNESYDGDHVMSDEEQSIYDIIAAAKKPVSVAAFVSKAGVFHDVAALNMLCEEGIILRETASKRLGADAVRSSCRLRVSPDEAEELLLTKLLTEQGKSVVRFLLENGSATLKDVCYYTGVTQGVLKTLEKKGIIAVYRERIDRTPEKSQKTGEKFVLTEKQREVYDGLAALYEANEPKCALLRGVTGSGKTGIYIELAKKAVADGRDVIMLVPEITLTPQAVRRFRAAFGDIVAVIHSALSVGERMDEYRRLESGAAKIAVGTRSAVFAPLKNIGLIIIDEEQVSSYYSEQSPRYHAQSVAKYLAAANNALLLLASATPSVSSYYHAKTGRYSLFELDERYGDNRLPGVYMADMRGEAADGNATCISRLLLGELQANAEKGEQSIILLNRRGYNTAGVCSECGEALKCDNCDIPLTYHSANKRLMCHYCGASKEYTEVCPTCGTATVHYRGSGTQKAVEELEAALPGVRVLRMDLDTTSSKESHSRMLSAFGKGKYDILLGTQMVAKGLDFENVTLVGVLSADASLFDTDFRADERTFSMMTQVIGRSGRHKAGRAVVQTYAPNHPILKLGAEQDYKAFYEDEILIRKQMLYPPFCDMCVLNVSAAGEELCDRASRQLYDLICSMIKSKYPQLPIRVMRPNRELITKFSSRHKLSLMLKCRDGKRFRAFLGDLLITINRSRAFSGVSVTAEINPE